jgi:hypothetical protein
MRIAGVDIGFTKESPLALVVVEMGHKPELLHCEMFYPLPGDKGKGWERAVDGIGEQLDARLALAGFDSSYLDLVAYELSHVRVNPQTAIKLAHMCGIVRRIATTACIPVVGVQPSQVKVALVGIGNATKEQMQRMAHALFGEDLSEHEADAVGVALAGAALMNFAKIH